MTKSMTHRLMLTTHSIILLLWKMTQLLSQCVTISLKSGE